TWEVCGRGVAEGECYKFETRTTAGHRLHKADPYGRYFEIPPRSAAIVCRTEGYSWGDDEWMAGRVEPRQHVTRPMAIYEAHLASWRLVPGHDNPPLTYRELARTLVPHGKTHVF